MMRLRLLSSLKKAVLILTLINLSTFINFSTITASAQTTLDEASTIEVVNYRWPASNKIVFHPTKIKGINYYGIKHAKKPIVPAQHARRVSRVARVSKTKWVYHGPNQAKWAQKRSGSAKYFRNPSKANKSIDQPKKETANETFLRPFGLVWSMVSPFGFTNPNNSPCVLRRYNRFFSMFNPVIVNALYFCRMKNNFI